MIDRLAPFATQEAFDNSGLLLGDPGREVRGIHFALDVTERVLDEAEAAGADLLVTHHPLMFSPVQQLVESGYEARLICRMIRNRMSLIAAHTNLDSAPGGINDTLAEMIGLTGVEGEGFLRVGSLAEAMALDKLSGHVAACLRTTVRIMGTMPEDRLIRCVAVSSGAGGDSWEAALQLGAEAFVTGEMKHHLALAAADAGLVTLEAGHFATEEPGIFALADTLQRLANEIQYKVRITKSTCGGYAAPQGR